MSTRQFSNLAAAAFLKIVNGLAQGVDGGPRNDLLGRPMFDELSAYIIHEMGIDRRPIHPFHGVIDEYQDRTFREMKFSGDNLIATRAQQKKQLPSAVPTSASGQESQDAHNDPHRVEADLSTS